MQIKTTMRNHLTPVRMAIFKKIKIKVGNNVEKREVPCTVFVEVNFCSHHGKHYGGSPKN